jgi:hypothetical protein
MTLFGVEHILPPGQETDTLAGTELREQAAKAVDSLLNGEIPMYGAACSGVMTVDTLLRRRGSRGE